jgi:tetratricopeptide (TPR) repeat protein
MSLELPENFDTYSDFKKKLLSREITPQELRDRLLALDQSSDDRSHAIANLDFLKDPDIVSWFQDNGEYLAKYYDFLSFTEFHVGQVRACSDGNYEEAQRYFKNALETSEKAGENEDWKNYIKATRAYFLSDIEAVEKWMEILPEGKNKEKVRSLLKGLQERGRPDYVVDYK